MATLADLRQAIDQLLGHPLGTGMYQLIQPVEEKAYEAYIFGLCLRASRELGASPVLRGIRGQPTPFVFRGAPGQIHSRGRNYGYAEFAVNGTEFEVHVCVEFRGTSGMTHEVDVAIMRAADARSCRQNPDDPSAASLVGCWECKFYAGALQKGLGRAFIGLVDDLGTNVRMTGFCSNSDHLQLRDYMEPQRRPHPYFRLTPLYPSNEDVFVNELKGVLKRLARA